MAKLTRQELGRQLGISGSMVTRLANRGMPVDDVAKAERWRRRHLEPGRVKGTRADTMPAAGDVSKTAANAPEEGTVREDGPAGGAAIQLDLAGAQQPGPAAGDQGEQLELAVDPGYQKSRSRQAAADATMAELKLAELEGSLVRIDQVRAKLASRLAPVREALLQIPARLAPLLAPQSDPGRIQTLLEVEIHQVLAPLSKAGDMHAQEGAGAV